MPDFKALDWVEDHQGRVGMVMKKNRRGSYLVKYGADGPFKTYHGAMLQPATAEQIAEKMGCGPEDLCEDFEELDEGDL